jgi:hypothetical protein
LYLLLVVDLLEEFSKIVVIFSSQEGQRLFSNREECRDIFYCIIRDSASTSADFTSEPIPASLKSSSYRRPTNPGTLSGSYGKPLFPRPEKPLDFPSRIRQLLAHLHGNNYPWLAKLFVQQIIQVASTGETDPEVRGLARQDTAKLQRLHSRLMGAGAASVRLAAGGTPTRESPGRSFKGLDGTSPVFVGGGRTSSPRLERILERQQGKTGRLAGIVDEREWEGGVKKDGLPWRQKGAVEEQAGADDWRQTVRRTLEEVFRESGDTNGELGPSMSTSIGKGNDGPPKDSAADFERAAEALKLRPHSGGTVSSQQPTASCGQHNEDGTGFRKGLSVAVARRGDPLTEDGPFGGLFSRSLLPYVRFLQAADSHRLHVLLVHCICDSIQSLSQ